MAMFGAASQCSGSFPVVQCTATVAEPELPPQLAPLAPFYSSFSLCRSRSTFETTVFYSIPGARAGALPSVTKHVLHVSCQHIDLPDDFAFEIIDNPGDQSVTLQREIAGEKIGAAIYTNFDTEEHLDDENDKSDKDEESFKTAIQMAVTIQKPESPVLEFDCNFDDDEVAIENMRVLNRDDFTNVYEGP